MITKLAMTTTLADSVARKTLTSASPSLMTFANPEDIQRLVEFFTSLTGSQGFTEHRRLADELMESALISLAQFGESGVSAIKTRLNDLVMSDEMRQLLQHLTSK